MKEAEKQKLLQKLRERSLSQNSGAKWSKDPKEWKPEQPKSPDEESVYRFYVLPHYNVGDVIDGNHEVTQEDVDATHGWYFYTHGYHWINNRRLECPRLHDQERCPICDIGFNLMRTLPDDKVARRKVAKNYLPSTKFAVNIYFPDNDKSPEDLRGKVMWTSVPKTVFDRFEACIHRDNAGDEDDPKAYGLFFDLDACYEFKMIVRLKGGYSTYEDSRFLPNTRGAILTDSKERQEVLKQRSLLHSKFASRDADQLTKIANQILNGDSSMNDEPGGFDAVESTESSKKTQTKAETKSQDKSDENAESVLNDDEALEKLLADLGD